MVLAKRKSKMGYYLTYRSCEAMAGIEGQLPSGF